MESRFSALQETDTLAVVRARKHVDRAELLDLVAGVLEWNEVAGEALRLARHVDQAVDAVVDDLREGLRMDTVPRRVEDDHIRARCVLVAAVLTDEAAALFDHLQHIAGDEIAVLDAVQLRVLVRSRHGLRDDLDTDRHARHGAHELRDRTGTGIEVVNHRLLHRSTRRIGRARLIRVRSFPHSACPRVACIGRGLLRRQSGKAGRSRWLGRRPHNRGVVMNPVDHPMGGGEGRQSGGHPRSRKGLYAKGLKTRAPKKLSNKYIIERANKK